MTSLYTTTSRLVGEYLDALLGLGWRLDDLDDDPDLRVVRLAGAALALTQQHAIDSKGRCRICTRRRHLRRTRTRPCTVYAALSFYLTQPYELALRQFARPGVDRSRPTAPEAETTVRLPPAIRA